MVGTIQVVIATVTDDANEYAKEIASNLDQQRFVIDWINAMKKLVTKLEITWHKKIPLS